MRHDVEGLKAREKRIDTLEEEVQKAKTWAKASTYFVGLFASVAALLKKMGVL